MLTLLTILSLLFNTPTAEKSSYSAIQIDRMDQLYIGIKNPITVVVEGLHPNDFYVETSGCGSRIKKFMWGRYTITCSKPSTPKNPFQIHVRNKKTGNLIQSFSFQVVRIPKAKVVLTNGMTDGKIPAAEMRRQRGIMVPDDGHYERPFHSIQGFTLYYTPRGQEPIEFINRGARFQPKVLELIKRAKPGDCINIINVKTHSPLCNYRANGLAFQVR